MTMSRDEAARANSFNHQWAVRLEVVLEFIELGSNSPAPPDNQVETPKKHDTEILRITFRQGIRKEK